MSPHHYEYLHGLAILDEDAIGADLGDCAGPDLSHYLGYGLCVVEVHVG